MISTAPHEYCFMQISGIGDITACSGSSGVVNFKVSPTIRHGNGNGDSPKVTTNITSTSVSINNN